MCNTGCTRVIVCVCVRVFVSVLVVYCCGYIDEEKKNNKLGKANDRERWITWESVCMSVYCWSECVYANDCALPVQQHTTAVCRCVRSSQRII